MHRGPNNPDADADATPEARAVDAAFDHSDPEVGTAVVKLVLSGAAFDIAAPRVEHALRAEEETVRRLGQVAAGDLARLQRRLTPAIYGLLRAAGLGSTADSAIKDVLSPRWFPRA